MNVDIIKSKWSTSLTNTLTEPSQCLNFKGHYQICKCFTLNLPISTDVSQTEQFGVHTCCPTTFCHSSFVFQRKTNQFRALKQSMPVPLTQDAQLKVHTVPSGLVLHGTLVLGSIRQLGPQDAQLTTARQQLIMWLEGERIRIVQNTRVFDYISVLHKLIPRLGEGRRYWPE